MNITFAGYGVWNSTRECTNEIKQGYAREIRTFRANNNWVGDPSPGERKYLYILWNNNGIEYSRVVGEDDERGIVLP